MTDHSLSNLQEKPARKTSQEISQLAAALGVGLCEPTPATQYAWASPDRNEALAKGEESPAPAYSQHSLEVSLQSIFPLGPRPSLAADNLHLISSSLSPVTVPQNSQTEHLIGAK